MNDKAKFRVVEAALKWRLQGEYREVRYCGCSEKGSDGTKNHTYFSGYIFHFKPAGLYFPVYPCRNHLRWYQRHTSDFKEITDEDVR